MDISHIYFGGSFFPPHKAHTEMLSLALKKHPNARLVLVPTKQNPLKDSPGAAVNIVQAWLEDLKEILTEDEFNRVHLETIEMTSSQDKNYTVDTLKALCEPNENWALLLGSDTASHFSQWKEPQKVLSLIKELWIVPRGPHSNSEIEKVIRNVDKKLPIKFLEAVTPISSTEIRDGTLSQRLGEFLSPRVLAVWKQVHS